MVSNKKITQEKTFWEIIKIKIRINIWNISILNSNIEYIGFWEKKSIDTLTYSFLIFWKNNSYLYVMSILSGQSLNLLLIIWIDLRYFKKIECDIILYLNIYIYWMWFLNIYYIFIISYKLLYTFKFSKEIFINKKIINRVIMYMMNIHQWVHWRRLYHHLMNN